MNYNRTWQRIKKEEKEKKKQNTVGDLGPIPGLGRSPKEGNGYPLQYSGLENPMDYIIHGVAKSQTQLSDFHFHFQDYINIKVKKQTTLKNALFQDAGIYGITIK